jgi:hypothetical protein
VPLVTAYLLREPTPIELESGKTRHPQAVVCGMCNERYAVDYESLCTDPSDLAKVLDVAQIVINREHFSAHRDAKVEVANTIHPSEERAQELINEMKNKIDAYYQRAS